ncbi:MAG: class SAM-dependent methyltransferase [Verrucomicrobiales bacterium]|nr:class SAM-dependent methyltransferase [Verrucomicrobiales bacterium]
MKPMLRVLEPELLDELPPADPRAIQSRRDLQRINWWMRNPHFVAKALRKSLPHPPKRMADLGAGDGAFSLELARKLSPHWKQVELVLVDRQPATVCRAQSFTALGWRSEFAVADVFEWLNREEKFDCIYANLFLHHFSSEQLRELFEKIARRTSCFVAVEPQRYRFSSTVRFLLWAIGCNDVTRNDGVISVRAGFRGQELSELWPKSGNWKLTETRSGLFSQVFSASKG